MVFQCAEQHNNEQKWHSTQTPPGESHPIIPRGLNENPSHEKRMQNEWPSAPSVEPPSQDYWPPANYNWGKKDWNKYVAPKRDNWSNEAASSSGPAAVEVKAPVEVKEEWDDYTDTHHANWDKSWDSPREPREDRRAHHHSREDRHSDHGKDWMTKVDRKNNPFFQPDPIEEVEGAGEKKEKVKEAPPPAPKRIPPQLPPAPPRGPRTEEIAAARAIPPVGPKAMPAAAKAPTSEPPVAPQPKAMPPVLTSDEVKRERAKARSAVARKLMADMAIMQQQMNTIIVEDELAAANEDLYT